MNIHQKMVGFFEKTMEAYFKAVILSLKIYENILQFNFLMEVWGWRWGEGAVLDILTVYTNILKRQFIDVKNNEVS